MTASRTHVESSALPEQGTQATRRPTLTIGKTIVTALLCALLGTGGGLLHGWLRARAADQHRAGELTALRGDLAQAKQQVQGAQRARSDLARLADLYEAYRLAQEALAALDARNFGTAESLLRNAERRLRMLVPTMPQLDELEQRMTGTILTVADDLAGQRTNLADIVTQLDGEIASARSELKLAAVR